MSTRTQTVPVEAGRSLEELLKEHELHITSPSNARDENRAGESGHNPPAGTNPPNWPTQYRRIPANRPPNRHLDLTERPNGANGIEYIFVTVMMRGVLLQSVNYRILCKTKWRDRLTLDNRMRRISGLELGSGFSQIQLIVWLAASGNEGADIPMLVYYMQREIFCRASATQVTSAFILVMGRPESGGTLPIYGICL